MYRRIGLILIAAWIVACEALPATVIPTLSQGEIQTAIAQTQAVVAALQPSATPQPLATSTLMQPTYVADTAFRGSLNSDWSAMRDAWGKFLDLQQQTQSNSNLLSDPTWRSGMETVLGNLKTPATQLGKLTTSDARYIKIVGDLNSISTETLSFIPVYQSYLDSPSTNNIALNLAIQQLNQITADVNSMDDQIDQLYNVNSFPASNATSIPAMNDIVTSVTLAKEVDRNTFAPISPTTVFQQTDVVHVVVHLQDAPSGTQLGFAFYFVKPGSSNATSVLLSSGSSQESGTRNVDDYIMPAPKWNKGEYRVEVTVGGILQQILNYTVQ